MSCPSLVPECIASHALVGRSPTVPDGRYGFKPMSGFVFAATIVAAQSDCSISTVVCVTSGCAKVKLVNRIIIFIE